MYNYNTWLSKTLPALHTVVPPPTVARGPERYSQKKSGSRQFSYLSARRMGSLPPIRPLYSYIKSCLVRDRWIRYVKETYGQLYSSPYSSITDVRAFSEDGRAVIFSCRRRPSPFNSEIWNVSQRDKSRASGPHEISFTLLFIRLWFIVRRYVHVFMRERTWRYRHHKKGVLVSNTSITGNEILTPPLRILSRFSRLHTLDTGTWCIQVKIKLENLVACLIPT